MRFLSALAVLPALSACAVTPAAAPTPLVTGCDGGRPHVCTMEYDPVCAQLYGGGRETYSSPCNACAHDAVRGYLRGACPE